MTEDRFKVLETHKAFPSADGITFAQFEARWTRALLEHKRVWDRENTVEIVELLRDAADINADVIVHADFEMAETVPVAMEWRDRLDALLDRVGGKKP